MAPTETQAAGAMALPFIDLNRERREERREVLRRSRRHAAAILMVVALAALIPLPLTIQILTLRREQQKVERQALGVRQRLQAVTAAGGETDAKIGRWTRLIQSQEARHAWEVAIPALAACLPQGVSAQQIQMSTKDKDAQIQLQGSAATMAELNAFTAALARSPSFARLHLDETRVGASGVTFQMTGPLNGPIASGAEPGAS